MFLGSSSIRFSAILLEQARGLKRDEMTTESKQRANQERPLAECCQIAVRCGPVSPLSIWFRSADATFPLSLREFVPSTLPFVLSPLSSREYLKQAGPHSRFGLEHLCVAWVDVRGMLQALASCDD